VVTRQPHDVETRRDRARARRRLRRSTLRYSAPERPLTPEQIADAVTDRLSAEADREAELARAVVQAEAYAYDGDRPPSRVRPFVEIVAAGGVAAAGIAALTALPADTATLIVIVVAVIAAARWCRV
jgi:negative regulator of sigma E activity